MAAQADRQSHLADDLVQAIVDINFGFAEARLHVMAGLEPLFRALAMQLLPAVIHESFRAHLAALLMRSAKVDISRPLQLTLHPDQIGAVGDILHDRMAGLVTLAADPLLSPHAALIGHGHVETILDHDALIRDIRLALANLFDEITESKAHG